MNPIPTRDVRSRLSRPRASRALVGALATLAAGVALAGLAVATLGTVSAGAATPLRPVLAADVVQWRPGITADELRRARVVRVDHGVRAADVAALRDDQVLRTPSGREMSVARFRALQAVVAQARQRAASRPPVPLEAAWNSAPHPVGAATPADPRARAADLLAGAPTRGVRSADGRTYSVAQLRAIAPTVERDWHVDLHGTAAPGTRPVPGARPARVVQVADANALMALSPSMPDDTVLQGPDGTRATFGQLKAQLKARYGHALPVSPQGGQR